MVVVDRAGSYIPSWLQTQLRAAGVGCLGVTCTEDASGAVASVQIVCVDGTAESAIDAVVSAYAPPPPPPVPGPTQAEKVATALAAIESDSSLAPAVQAALAKVVKALS